jgi:UDP-N-acetylmuramate dehydrogenase
MAFDLTTFNTLRVPAKAANFLQINSLSDLKRLSTSEPVLFLGQGANILFTKDFPGTVAKVNLSGIKIISETESEVIIEAAAGQNWHELVEFAVNHNWSGLENMALIPGTAGAAPIGNIAAYGGNQEDVFESLDAIDMTTGKTEVFSKPDCKFLYRDSIFKTPKFKHYFISAVRYKLSRIAHLELTYHAARHASLLPTLQKIAKEPFTIKNVFDAIVKLRTEKLPDPKTFPNAGSFFKNPLVSKSKYLQIKSQIPDIQWYPPEKLGYTDGQEIPDQVKIPAGMLIDYLGWRGKRIGNVGIHQNHGLIVVNYGATGFEILTFAESVLNEIKTNFGISLNYEVQIY